MGAEQTAPHTPPPAAQIAYAGIEELWATERLLKGYNASIVEKLARYFRHENSVLEFGAGIGTLAALWQQTTGTKPECLEIDAGLGEILRGRSFTCFDSVQAISKQYDYIYSSNVLEHIEDDVAALKHLRTLLKDGAYLAIYVPAFMCLYSAHDVSVGHYRRYGKAELIRKLRLADFKVVHASYADCVGFFVSLAGKYIGYNRDSTLENLRVYDKYLYPVSKFLDRMGCRFFFGKNIVIFARK